MSERLYQVAAASFEAARRLDTFPGGHRARNLHGHGFRVRARALPHAPWALPERLMQCIAPLDYSLLNEHVAVPTDANLARWVRRRLDVPGAVTVGIRSTPDQGAELDPNDRVQLWRRFRFEAAHRLPHVPAGHKCGRMHGHGFDVILHADEDMGSGIDHDRLAAGWAPLAAKLHHACLNDIPGLENPTSERLAAWIWQRIKPELAELCRVTVYETATAGCHYDGDRYRIWKEQSFESALRLERAPEGDPRRRLHGHSYLIRLHLGAQLDEVLGWTVDYGDVKELFKPVHRQLDHHLLNELSGLADADPAGLVRWIRGRVQTALPQLDRIDLYEAPGCGVILSWNERGAALPA